MDQSQFIEEIVNAINQCKPLKIASILPSVDSSDDLREFDQALVSAIEEITLPSDWSLVGKKGTHYIHVYRSSHISIHCCEFAVYVYIVCQYKCLAVCIYAFSLIVFLQLVIILLFLYPQTLGLLILCSTLLLVMGLIVCVSICSPCLAQLRRLCYQTLVDNYLLI